MHMIDWNNYRKQLATGVGGLAKLSPDTVKGYGLLGQANSRTGSLETKTRELIALAVAISLRCDGCIATHTAEARLAQPRRKLQRRSALPSVSTQVRRSSIPRAPSMRWTR